MGICPAGLFEVRLGGACPGPCPACVSGGEMLTQKKSNKIKGLREFCVRVCPAILYVWDTENGAAKV